MTTHGLNLQVAKRPLTEAEQREIAAFFEAHPKEADYEKHSARLAKKFNCSVVSVGMSVLRAYLGDFK